MVITDILNVTKNEINSIKCCLPSQDLWRHLVEPSKLESKLATNAKMFEEYSNSFVLPIMYIAGFSYFGYISVRI